MCIIVFGICVGMLLHHIPDSFTRADVSSRIHTIALHAKWVVSELAYFVVHV